MLYIIHRCPLLSAVIIYSREPDGLHRRLWAITFDLVNRFTKTRRISRALAVPHLRVAAAYASPAGSRPPGTGPKLACARPLSRRKTSPNGHKTLSADSSRHALQLSSYKRPLKRPLTRPNRPCKNTHFLPFGPSSPPDNPHLTAKRGVGGRIRPNKVAARLFQTKLEV